MPLPLPSRRRSGEDPVTETELWFVRHGMPWFVPAERSRAKAALSPRRFVPLAGVAVLGGLGLALGLAWLSGSRAAAPAVLMTYALLGLVVYGLTAMRARPILTYALSQTGASLPRLLPMATRTLPMLLVFMTFLFVNAEVWMMSAYLDGASLWVTVMLFVILALGFFVVRLPEEIERADDELDDARVVEVCRGTPLEAEAPRLAKQRPGLLAQESHVIRYERLNLTLVLMITQLVQVLLLALTVFVFFLVFGLITMQPEIVDAWIGDAGTNYVEWFPSLSVELVQVSIFLAAFAGFYFTVYALTDDSYRQEFFTGVVAELERAIAVRAAYVALCRESGVELEVEIDEEIERRRSEARERPPGDDSTRQMPLP